MTEFWEANFMKKGEMWGFEPCFSAIVTKDFFVEKKLKNILIPGFGYGRNAQIFKDAEMVITGIEISKTAIEMARKHFGAEMNIYHGSVTDMPFDKKIYDGIFCYALIHLLDSSERQKLILDCYNQLSDGGYMFFTAITKDAPMYGKGNFISENRFEIYQGVKMYFYDKNAVESEFGKAGLYEIIEVDEVQPMFLIKCRKGKP